MFNFEITDEQIESFSSDGFVVVDRIISDENVALLRERLDVLFSDEYETGIGPDDRGSAYAQ